MSNSSDINFYIPIGAATFNYVNVSDWADEQNILTINDINLEYNNGDCIVHVTPFDIEQATPENRAKLWLHFVRWFD